MKHWALSTVIPIHSFHFVGFNLICVVHSFLRSHSLGWLEALLQRIDKALTPILNIGHLQLHLLIFLCLWLNVSRVVLWCFHFFVLAFMSLYQVFRGFPLFLVLEATSKCLNSLRWFLGVSLRNGKSTTTIPFIYVVVLIIYSATNCLRALSKSQNWPAGPWPDQSFWRWNRLFATVFLLKNHLLSCQVCGV